MASEGSNYFTYKSAIRTGLPLFGVAVPLCGLLACAPPDLTDGGGVSSDFPTIRIVHPTPGASKGVELDANCELHTTIVVSVDNFDVQERNPDLADPTRGHWHMRIDNRADERVGTGELLFELNLLEDDPLANPGQPFTINVELRDDNHALLEDVPEEFSSDAVSVEVGEGDCSASL